MHLFLFPLKVLNPEQLSLLETVIVINVKAKSSPLKSMGALLDTLVEIGYGL